MPSRPRATITACATPARTSPAAKAAAIASLHANDELLARTTLTEDEIGEYSGARKEIRPVTIATYQVLTLKRKGIHPHLELLDARDWGLIVYDEVHLLPAPIFRMTADLQARRRLGLTATLVREDGREGDVFSLIGPKRYDAPWKDIEAQGWIAPADCVEVRVGLSDAMRMAYATAEPDERYRLAACAAEKLPVVERLVERHRGEPTLVIGQYLDQIDVLSEALDAPKITGATPVDEREELYGAFREGRIRCLTSVGVLATGFKPERGLGALTSPSYWSPNAIADEAQAVLVSGTGDGGLIDFALSNLVNSGYLKIVVLTQYKSHSLDRDVSQAWRLASPLGHYVAPIPAQQRRGKSWYTGSADAIYQSLNAITDERPDIVVVVGADHVYRMDFSDMVEQHLDTGAECTVAAIRQPISTADQFGVMEVGADGRRITAFREKPTDPVGLPDAPHEVYASMGNYVFSADALIDAVTRDDTSRNGRRWILPPLTSRIRPPM